MGYKSPRTYTICGTWTLSTWTDATTYYAHMSLISTAAAARRIPVPINGIIRQIKVYTYSSTVAGSVEDWVFSVYDGTTDTPIATVGSLSAERTWYNANLNYPVSASGYIQLKTTTPAWATNPEGTVCQFEIVVEYE